MATMPLKHFGASVSKFALIAGTIVLLPAGALAQNSPDPEPVSQNATEEDAGDDVIVVTARKREENLQETPVSIIALGAESLDDQNVDDLSDLNSKVPNAFIGSGGGNGTNGAGFAIRGIGQGRDAVAQESSVALYIDDEYLSKSTGTLVQLVDVERIEVLRGPQGTLFGKNAIGGAIRYVTKKPNFDEFSGRVQVNIGNLERRDFKAFLNIPFSDSAALRVAAGTINQDGYLINGLGQDLGDTHVNLFRATLRLRPTDSLEILANFDYSETDQNGSANSTISICTRGQPNTKCPGPGFPNGISQAIAAGFVFDPTTFRNTRRNGSLLDAFFKQESIGASLTANYDISENTALKVFGSYRNLQNNFSFDLDSTAAPLLHNENVDRQSEVWSAEVQLGGTAVSDRLKWVTGLYYYTDESYDLRNARQAWDPPTPGGAFDNPGSSTIRFNEPFKNKSVAIYGQGTFDVTDRLALTIGARYTWDDLSIVIRELQANGTPILFPASDSRGRGGTPFILTQAAKFDDWSGRVSLEYKVTDDIFLFTSYSRGYEGGSLNDRGQITLPEALNYGASIVDPSILKTWEVGIRSELFDRRLRLNVTYFDNDFSNVKVATAIILPTATVILDGNGGTATSRGVEVEGRLRLTDNFSVDFAAGYLDAKYTQGGANIDIGSPLTRSPDFSYSVGAEYDVDIGVGNLNFRLDWSWRDEFVTNSTRDGAFIVGNFGLLDGNIRFTPSNDRWTIAMYGKNILDKKYYDNALDFSPQTPFGYVQGIPGKPAEYGVKAEYRF